MQDTIIVDLDGTLANIDHRLHFIKQEKPDWKSFYKACVNDMPNKWCVRLIKSLILNGHYIDIVSARSDMVYSETWDWLGKSFNLRDSGFFKQYINLHLIREKNDTTPDVDLKKNWLKTIDKNRILFVVDDRQRVVDMWREEGLVCLQAYQWKE